MTDVNMANRMKKNVWTVSFPVSSFLVNAEKELSLHGLIAVDNVLWSGRVLSPKDDSDRAIAALNDRISQDPRVRHVLLPIRDGVMLVHKA